jgi:hypothetical protein
MVNVTRQNLTDLQARVVGFGAVKSIAFKGVTPNGADIYDVAFEKHDMQWRIVLGADGKTESIGLTILP